MKNRKVFFAAALAATAQYYDYYLYGLLAASISHNFFSNTSHIVQLQKTYLIMFVGVFAKPIGALIIGRIGDIYGRSRTLNYALFWTSMSSLIISVIPRYADIGILAVFILLLCRMCISACVSPGTDGVRLLIFESISKDRQCFGNGLVTFATMVGILSASLSAWFFTLDIWPDYFWRFCFVVGSILGISTIYIRNILHKDTRTEDELLKTSENYNLYKNIPTYKIVIKHLSLFLLAALVVGCIGSSYQFILIFYGTYVFDVLHLYGDSIMKLYTSVAVVVYMVFAIIAGVCADYYGRLKIANLATIFVLLLIICNAYIISLGRVSIVAFLLIAAFLPFLNMPALAILKRSIPPVIRFRVFSLAHALGSITISGTTAYLATTIYKYFTIAWLPTMHLFCVILLMAVVINILSNIYHEEQQDN